MYMKQFSVSDHSVHSAIFTFVILVIVLVSNYAKGITNDDNVKAFVKDNQFVSIEGQAKMYKV